MVDREGAHERHPNSVNRTRPVRLGWLIVLVAIVLSGSIDCSPQVRHTLVARAKTWGSWHPDLRSELMHLDPQFGFGDSLVLELESGPTLGEQRSTAATTKRLTDLEGFSLGATAPDGRVWLRLHGALLVLNERGANWPSGSQDSILLGPEPVMLTERSADGGSIYALRIRRGILQARAARRRVSIRGVVRSKWTGEWSFRGHGSHVIPHSASALVTVAYGDTFTFADSTGAFELRGVPEGRVRINAIGLPYPRQFGSVVVDAPDDSVTVLVDDDEKGWEFFVGPPAQAIEVLLPGQRRQPPPDPRTVPGRLEWLPGKWEGVLTVLPRTSLAASRNVPVRCEFASPTPGGDVRWVMRDASSPAGNVLAEHRVHKRLGPWGPRRSLYNAAGTQWRFRAVGDSLLGLELDAPEGNPVHRLHIHRVPEHARIQ